MSRYTSKFISNHELLYVVSSLVIGRDMREMFYHYGIPLSETALNSVADHGLPTLSPAYYAMVLGQGNKPELGQWLDISTTVPAYPF